MDQMFNDAKAFNSALFSNVKNVETMSLMFAGALKFNQNISGWQVYKLKNVHEMFKGATSFKQSLSAVS